MSGPAGNHGNKQSTDCAFVLDDDPQIGALVCAALKACGFVPEQFTSPEPFLTQLKTAAPDLIVLDLSLGQSDAIEVIRELETGKYQGKVLLISGRDETTLNEIARIGERRGLAMLPSLKKPFRPRDVKERLSNNAASPAQAEAENSRLGPNVPSPIVELREALRSNWVELWYQPKIDLRSFSICGAEGLVRARHPVHGVILPNRLLPPTGDPAYQPLAKFAVLRTSADWVRFAERGLRLNLAMNAPVSIINTPAFVGYVRSVLPSDPTFPGLTIEVTEDELIRDSEAIREIATQLKLYNIGLSIDDFGSGCAALSRLQDLPFVEIKIDRSFVSGCASDQLKHSLCRSVIELAHQLGSTCCAEGVETIEDLHALVDMQCDTAQGFLFAKAMPAAELASGLLGSFAKPFERQALSDKRPQNVARGT